MKFTSAKIRDLFFLFFFSVQEFLLRYRKDCRIFAAHLNDEEMAVESVVVGKPEPKREYPYLGRHNNEGAIMLFIKPKNGVVVSPSSTWNVGFQSMSFDEVAFTPLSPSESVTLRNM